MAGLQAVRELYAAADQVACCLVFGAFEHLEVRLDGGSAYAVPEMNLRGRITKPNGLAPAVPFTLLLLGWL